MIGVFTRAFGLLQALVVWRKSKELRTAARRGRLDENTWMVSAQMCHRDRGLFCLLQKDTVMITHWLDFC
jgi:hypothetical protein